MQQFRPWLGSAIRKMWLPFYHTFLMAQVPLHLALPNNNNNSIYSFTFRLVGFRSLLQNVFLNLLPWLLLWLLLLAAIKLLLWMLFNEIFCTNIKCQLICSSGFLKIDPSCLNEQHRKNYLRQIVAQFGIDRFWMETHYGFIAITIEENKNLDQNSYFILDLNWEDYLINFAVFTFNHWIWSSIEKLFRYLSAENAVQLIVNWLCI